MKLWKIPCHSKNGPSHTLYLQYGVSAPSEEVALKMAPSFLRPLSGVLDEGATAEMVEFDPPDSWLPELCGYGGYLKLTVS